jgi:hypothetical protein
MKVRNMTGRTGREVANQFEIRDDNGNVFFQSYDSIIVKVERVPDRLPKVYLDSTFWDYSVTTGKYRNQFLGETKAETEKKIKSGEYILTDLN